MQSFSSFNNNRLFPIPNQTNSQLQGLKAQPITINQPHKNLPFSSSLLQQQKISFLKYASSLLQIQIQNEKQHHFIVYQQSQLINPPDTLIMQYQNITNPSNTNKNNKTNNNHYKNIPNNDLKVSAKDYSPQNNLNQKLFKEQKSLLPPLSRPIKPTVKRNTTNNKYNVESPQKQVINQNKCKIKQQGAKRLVGELTFKMLSVESQSFYIIKQYAEIIKLTQFYTHLSRIFLKLPFNKISSYSNNFTYPSKSKPYSNTKIFILSSKSKSKLSSKIKTNSHKFSKPQKNIFLNNNSISIHNTNNDINLSTTDEQHFNYNIINSEILQNFNRTQLKSSISSNNQNQQNSYTKSQKKLSFANRIKKKTSTQSFSQADTMNSKRSLQSEQYQFGLINSSRNYIQVKSLSKRYFQPISQDIHTNDCIPTEKIIGSSANVKKKKQLFRKITSQMQEAKLIQMFKTKQRRYMNVRTNLFELPIQQMNFDNHQNQINYQNQQLMSKVYHLMPDGQLKNQIIDNTQDSFVSMNIDVMKLPQNLRRVHSQRSIDTLKVQQQKRNKTKAKNGFDNDFQKYYFNSKTSQNNNPNINNTASVKAFQQAKHQPTIKYQMIQINKEPTNKGHQAYQRLNSQNQKQYQNIKLCRKDLNQNFQMYYFNTQHKSNKSPYVEINSNKNQFNEQFRTSRPEQNNLRTTKIKSVSPSVSNKLLINSPYRSGNLGNQIYQHSSHRSSNSSFTSNSIQTSNKQLIIQSQQHLINYPSNSAPSTPLQSAFAKTVSNLSNQSRSIQTTTSNQMFPNYNQPTSMISNYSKEGRYKINSQIQTAALLMLSPTHRPTQDKQKEKLPSKSPRIIQAHHINQRQTFTQNPNQPLRRGLNVMMNNHPLNSQKPQSSSNTKNNSIIRSKSPSQQKIFLTLKK